MLIPQKKWGVTANISYTYIGPTYVDLVVAGITTLYYFGIIMVVLHVDVAELRYFNLKVHTDANFLRQVDLARDKLGKIK